MPRKLPPQCRPQLLTPEQEKIVREAIAAGATRDEAAALAGVSPARLWARLRDQLKDVRVGRGRRPHRGPRVDPTPDEIRYACAMVRRTWTEERYLEELPDIGEAFILPQTSIPDDRRGSSTNHEANSPTDRSGGRRRGIDGAPWDPADRP